MCILVRLLGFAGVFKSSPEKTTLLNHGGGVKFLRPHRGSFHRGRATTATNINNVQLPMPSGEDVSATAESFAIPPR